MTSRASTFVSVRRVRPLAGILLFSGLLARPAAGQGTPSPAAGSPQDGFEPPQYVLSAAVARLDVFGSLDATYGGLTLDRMGPRWGLSGGVMVGRGSDGGTWVHLPLAGMIAGLAVVIPLSLLEGLWEDGTGEDPDWIPRFAFELLAFENVHRNVPLGESVVLSPYLGVLSLDAEGGDNVDGFTSLSSGLGLSVRFRVAERLLVAPDVSLRHHWILTDPTSDDDSRFGSTVSLRAGYVF